MARKLNLSIVLLPLVAVTVMALSLPNAVQNRGLLQMGTLEDEKISGKFYPKGKSSSWCIVFSVNIEGYDIVSTSDILNSMSSKLVLTFVKLSLPARYQHDRVIPSMREKVVRAARKSYKAFNTASDLPTIDELFEAYEDFVAELFKVIPHEDNEINEIALSLMYHSTIVTSVRRITEGTVSDDEICEESPTYTYGSTLFLCSQELKILLATAEGSKIRISDNDVVPAPPVRERRVTTYTLLSGSDHGCCGNYAGPCYYANPICYAHDRLCTCCGSWWCFGGCKPDAGCE